MREVHNCSPLLRIRRSEALDTGHGVGDGCTNARGYNITTTRPHNGLTGDCVAGYIITSTVTTLPSAQQTLHDLAPLVAVLHYEFRRVWRESVRPYFEHDARAIDEVTAGFLLRDQVGYSLKRRRGVSLVEDGDTSTFTFSELALKGLEGTFKNYGFKILRSRDGQIPSPRNSERRSDFYAQQLRLPGLAEATGQTHNIVFLWDFSEDYNVFTLRIAMPLQPDGSAPHFNELAAQPEDDDDIDLDVTWNDQPETAGSLSLPTGNGHYDP